MMARIKYVVNIVIVALLFGAVAISRDGRILGESVEDLFQSSAAQVEELAPEVEEVMMDGTRVINSTSLATDVVGFSGLTPVKVYIKDDVILRVETEPNSETESFFRKVTQSGLLDKWSGKSLSEAVEIEVDNVSGATYSARAVTENVRRAIAYGASVEPSSRGLFAWLDFKAVVGIIVILIGVCLTFMKRKSRGLDVAYMILNVVVLGLWCGSFLSLSQFVSWMSNGFNLSLTIFLLAVVILMPIFGHKGSYCQRHCPMGSAQELMWRIPSPEIKLGAKLTKSLNHLRYYILMILLLLMWVGVGFEIMDYELFSAFLIGSASNVVLALAVVFLILSLFIKRPYCRFICPTGAMITTLQKTKE